MNFDATQILPGLYQGAVPPEGRVLHDLGFNLVVLCAYEYQNLVCTDVLVERCPMHDDNLTNDEWRRAQAAASRVVDVVQKGGRALVTCAAGRNRSGLVTAIAMHQLTGLPGSRCVAYIQRRRFGSLTNPSFVEALSTLGA